LANKLKDIFINRKV